MNAGKIRQVAVGLLQKPNLVITVKKVNGWRFSRGPVILKMRGTAIL